MKSHAKKKRTGSHEIRICLKPRFLGKRRFCPKTPSVVEVTHSSIAFLFLRVSVDARTFANFCDSWSVDSLSTTLYYPRMKEGADITAGFGQRVREMRKAKGLSQEAFAVECGLDRTYISGIERGRRNVSLRNIELIAKALGISISDLTHGL